jgi:hypothetical protein
LITFLVQRLLENLAAPGAAKEDEPVQPDVFFAQVERRLGLTHSGQSLLEHVAPPSCVPVCKEKKTGHPHR